MPRQSTEIAFPRDSLKKALRLATSIRDNNAGRPYDRILLAKSVEYSPNSSGFRQLIVSAGRYGVTDGGYQADRIGLTALGSSIVSPTREGEDQDGIRAALLSPPVFREVLTHYDRNSLPKEELFKNALNKVFSVPPEDVDACYVILRQNMTDFQLLEDIRGNEYLRLDRLGESTPGTSLQLPRVSQAQVPTELEATYTPSVPEPTLGRAPNEPAVFLPAHVPPKSFVARVFVSHSKNRRILSQIKDILDFGQIEHRVAVETDTTAIPIPDKVFGLMRECNCAIINLSADEGEKHEDGEYVLNPNVLIEIGGAFLAYDRRVILLVDRRLKVPSNLQGLSVLYYQGEELDFEIAMKLQKALAQFRRAAPS